MRVLDAVARVRMVTARLLALLQRSIHHPLVGESALVDGGVRRAYAEARAPAARVAAGAAVAAEGHGGAAGALVG